MKSDKTIEQLTNSEFVKWLNGTKVPGAIVVTNDFAEKLTKTINAHALKTALEIIEKLERLHDGYYSDNSGSELRTAFTKYYEGEME